MTLFHAKSNWGTGLINAIWLLGKIGITFSAFRDSESH